MSDWLIDARSIWDGHHKSFRDSGLAANVPDSIKIIKMYDFYKSKVPTLLLLKIHHFYVFGWNLQAKITKNSYFYDFR